MSTSPRNVRYFPRMKVRGAQRKRQAFLRRLERTSDNFVEAALRMSISFAVAADAMTKLGLAACWDAGLLDKRAEVSTAQEVI